MKFLLRILLASRVIKYSFQGFLPVKASDVMAFICLKVIWLDSHLQFETALAKTLNLLLLLCRPTMCYYFVPSKNSYSNMSVFMPWKQLWLVGKLSNLCRV